eukprot:6189367-Pleurochrysis_carterae.AAC.1
MKARLKRMDRTETEGQLVEGEGRPEVGDAPLSARAARLPPGLSGCGVCGVCTRVVGGGAGDAAKKGSEALAAGTVP